MARGFITVLYIALKHNLIIGFSTKIVKLKCNLFSPAA